jgi:hypothetical protein
VVCSQISGNSQNERRHPSRSSARAPRGQRRDGELNYEISGLTRLSLLGEKNRDFYASVAREG